MKARLIYFQGVIQLLICNGQILNLTTSEAREFLTHFDSPKYYSDEGTWDNSIITIEAYRGITIAFVDYDDVLHIKKSELFRNILFADDTHYLSVKEYAEKYEKTEQMVRRMCMNGRIDGAVQKGKVWLIPESSPYPADARVRRNYT